MKKIFIKIILLSVVCFLVSCAKGFPFKELNEADKQTLRNLDEKNLKDIVLDSEKTKVLSIFERFFIDNMDHEQWHKNHCYMQSLDKSDCQSFRSSCEAKSYNKQAIKTNLKNNFNAFLNNVQNYRPIDIYLSFIAYASKEADLAKIKCGDDYESARKKTLEKYFNNDVTLADLYSSIYPIISQYFKNAL